jgi:hypothetical protein
LTIFWAKIFPLKKKAALNESPSKESLTLGFIEIEDIDFMLFLATQSKLVHDFNQFTTIIA